MLNSLNDQADSRASGEVIPLHTAQSASSPANSAQTESTPEPQQWFRQIVAAQLQGQAALPYGVGLSDGDYQQLLDWLAVPELSELNRQWQASSSAGQRAELYQQMCQLKADELQSLRALLLEHCRDHQDPANHWMLEIIVHACMAPSHLWSSLGLSTRAELGVLLHHYFPALAAANTQRMRWKRFFYRQLCQNGGDYVCRAPSCGECSSFSECFAPED